MKINFYKLSFLLAMWFINGLTHSSTPMMANLSATLPTKASTCSFGLANCFVGLKVNDPTPGRIMITNNSGVTALNIHATLPASWTDVTQDATACTSLAVGNSCVILFYSGATSYAIETIPVKGSNTNTIFFDMVVA